MYCKKCNINYVDNSQMYGDEYIDKCPLCLSKQTVENLQDKIKDINFELRKYQICDECQSKMGFCDKDRPDCEILKRQLQN